MHERFPDGNLELSRSLMRALRHTGISLIYQDRSLRVVWAQNVPVPWTSRDVIGLTDLEFLPAAEAERVVLAKQAVLRDAVAHSLEIRIDDSNTAYWYEISIDADKSADGDLKGIITTVIDVTDRKRREQTLRALLREVSHRSKNLLAIIQSIATQTGRYSDSIDGFLSRFRGRLQSLSSSQDLVTSSNWRGADLRELVVGQLGRYVADPARRVRLQGINPYLNPNAALHIGLALHELAVNSVSFGALSQPEGSVTISAEMGAGPALNLAWQEAIRPREGDRNGKKRFGSVALERVVPASLNGSATLTIGATELEYRLTVPSGSFELE
jgi:two-component sensor histidine kinase